MEERMEKLEEKMANLDGLTSQVQDLIRFLTDQPSNDPNDNNDQTLEQEQQLMYDQSTVDSETGEEDEVENQAGFSDTPSVFATVPIEPAEPTLPNSSDSLISQSDNSFAFRLNKYNKQEKTADAVSDELADFVNQTVTKQLDNKKYLELAEKFNRPANAKFLVAPKVNREIWKILPEYAQKKGHSSQESPRKIG